MLGQTVLIFSPACGKYVRSAVRSLRSGGSYVGVTDSLAAAREVLASSLAEVVVVFDAGASDLALLARERGDTPLLEVQSNTCGASLADSRFDEHSRVYSSGSSPVQLGRQVAVIVESLLTRSLFGPEKWLPQFGVDYSNYSLSSSNHRDELIQCMTDYLQWLGVRKTAQRPILSAADELATNAIYNAPVDESGYHLFAGVSRSRAVQLPESHGAIARFGSDGERFALSVRDPFGSLTWPRLSVRLDECFRTGEIERKPGGAGLGMYTLLRTAEQVTISVAPTCSAEIVAIFNVREPRRSGFDLHWISASPEERINTELSAEYRRVLIEQLVPSDSPPLIPLMPRAGMVLGTGQHDISKFDRAPAGSTAPARGRLRTSASLWSLPAETPAPLAHDSTVARASRDLCTSDVRYASSSRSDTIPEFAYFDSSDD